MPHHGPMPAAYDDDQRVRVVLADDHPVVRGGLRALLESLGGYVVVAEAVDGEQAVRAAQTLRPDVVIMDIRMPGVDGLEATRRITAAVPGTAVVVLTMYDDDDVVFGAMRAGARGYCSRAPRRRRSTGRFAPSSPARSSWDQASPPGC